MKKILLVGILIVGFVGYAQAAPTWIPIGTWNITLSGDHFTKLSSDNIVFVETLNEQGTITIETDLVGSARIILISPSSSPIDGPFMGIYNPDNTFNATRSGNDWVDTITGSIDATNMISGLFHLEDLYYGPNADVIRLNYTGSPVPLPSAVWLLGSGIVGLAGTRLGRKKQ